MTVVNPWPKEALGKIVFLLDANTKIEQAILENYLRDTCPGGLTYQTLPLSLRSQKLPQANLTALENSYFQAGDLFYVPLRLAWQVEGQSSRKGVSFKGLILGNSSNPGLLRQRILYKSMRHSKEPVPYSIIVGKGASLAEMEARFKKNCVNKELSHFIARSAFLALERAERSVKGSRYKVPRMVDEEVLRKPQLIQSLTEISKESGRSMDDLMKEAGDCLREMAATPTPAGLDVAAALGRFMYTRGFDEEINFAPGDLDRIRKLLSERPMAFLFTHKSHIDGFLLIALFHDLNLPPLHTFGGINMGFMGLGTLLRKAGAIFIRRSFKGDDVYKSVFKSYIDYLGEKRFPVMWALEGTRSRTGKLMPPRFGLINYVVSAYLRDDAPDLMLMPISIIYDQIPEVSDYDSLQAGGKKRPESASWFMQYLSGLKNPYGKIHVRFGQGIQISDYIDTSTIDSRSGSVSPDRRDMQKIAFALAVDVNKATPITVNSLITYVLLEHGHRAITFNQLNTEINRLQEFIALFNFPMTIDVGHLTPEILERSLRQLAVTGVINIAEEGVEVLYMIPYNTGRTAAYYRNGLIHFFITSAIADIALLAVTEEGEAAIEQFHQEALFIRDLLKYEFFFEGSDDFIRSLDRELSARVPTWRDIIIQGKKAIRLMLRELKPIVGHGTLRPFLESYLVFARTLSLIPVGTEVDIRKLIADSLALGKQRVLQQRIHCEESVSQSYFDNAVKIAESRGLLENSQSAVQGRLQWLEELRSIVANVRILASVAEAKRLAEIIDRQHEHLS